MEPKTSSKIKRIFNGANILLFLLVATTIANSFLIKSIINNSNVTNQEETVEVRVLRSKRDNFKQIFYHVWYQNGIWEMQTDQEKVIPDGRKIKLSGQIKEYNLSGKDTKSFDQYKRTNRIFGRIETKSEIQIQDHCDIICKAILQINKIRFKIEMTYQDFACHKANDTVKFVDKQNNCQDIFALSYGLILGGTEKFTPETYQNIKTLGLSHLVAVSGFQVVLVLTFFEWITTKTGFSRKFRIIFAVLGILGLVLLAGPQPPILRSSISVSLSLFVLTFLGRRLSSFRALLYSGIILLWINPLYLWSASFQLSFLASFALITQSSLNNQKENWEIAWLKNLNTIFATSLLAFLFTLPIVLDISGKVNPFSVITNLLLAPTIPLISILNLVGLIPFVGQIFLFITTFFESMIISIVNNLSTWPLLERFNIYAPEGVRGWEFAFYYFILVSIIAIVKLIKFKKPHKSSTA